MRYDFTIVGAGIFGAVFARKMVDAGKKVLVIDRRSHIGGNCYTEENNGIHVHKYGPHIMHTSSDKVWHFINQYTKMNNFTLRIRVNFEGKIYSFPINMNTMNQMFGVITPEEAEKKISELQHQIISPANLEEWILSRVGSELYKTFIEGYTTKQWGKCPIEPPTAIIKRLPIRFTYNDNYFNDTYQGIPVGGYKQFFEKLLEGIEVRLNEDYLTNRDYYNKISDQLIYCGKIDEFFNYEYGELAWRSLKFDHQLKEVNNFQGCAVMNYTSADIPFTRIIEHKHFEETSILKKMGKTCITY